MKRQRTRLDVELFRQGLFPSREAARRAVMAGWVRVDGQLLDKPGTPVVIDVPVELVRSPSRYVSRGGLKLERALQEFDVSLNGKRILDVGASTGGFTDCALQFGADFVYAVDVGYGQLAWKLRSDPRVMVLERTNFRHISAELLNPPPEIAVMDVSFISIRLLLDRLKTVLTQPADLISLIKPQFEAGRGRVGKGGIVRDPQVHMEVLLDIIEFAANLELECKGITVSPITGGDGNIEFLVWWHWPGATGCDLTGSLSLWRERVRQVVLEAWRELKGCEVEM
ncbi:TlyA family RNA methyltransferase [Alicyclobacillaceae bacterium I2511]|nr:TlyA family RNA methyltransferase [Alicyclobacillaceae bacterium I2511]